MFCSPLYTNMPALISLLNTHSYINSRSRIILSLLATEILSCLLESLDFYNLFFTQNTAFRTVCWYSSLLHFSLLVKSSTCKMTPLLCLDCNAITILVLINTDDAQIERNKTKFNNNSLKATYKFCYAQQRYIGTKVLELHQLIRL